MRHMVAGVAPATMAVAAQLGLRREDDPEGEGEGGRHGEHRELTLGKLVRVARSEEAGRRRDDPRRLGRPRGRSERRRRCRRPRGDSLHGKVQLGEAETTAASAGSGMASITGDMKGGGGGGHGGSEARVRVSRGKSRGERRGVVGEASYPLAAGGVPASSSWERSPRHGASGNPVATGERES